MISTVLLPINQVRNGRFYWIIIKNQIDILIEGDSLPSIFFSGSKLTFLIEYLAAVV